MNRAVLIVGALATGGISAGVAMLATAVVLRLTGHHDDPAAWLWLLVGSVTGAAAGGWCSQPFIARLEHILSARPNG